MAIGREMEMGRKMGGGEMAMGRDMEMGRKKGGGGGYGMVREMEMGGILRWGVRWRWEGKHSVHCAVCSTNTAESTVHYIKYEELSMVLSTFMALADFLL